MKKTLLILSFVILAVSIYAQTGLWGIAFDQKIADTKAALKKAGFSIATESETYINATNKSITILKEMNIYFNKETKQVSSWSIYFDRSKATDARDQVMKLVESTNGEYSFYDDEYDEYVWELENGNAIYFSPNSENLTVSYDIFDDYYYDWWW